jgi:hypothetical protein
VRRESHARFCERPRGQFPRSTHQRNGFALWSKKIESGEKYHWPRLLEEEVVQLTVEQLNWLLDGYDIWTQPHRMIKFQHAS